MRLQLPVRRDTGCSPVHCYIPKTLIYFFFFLPTVHFTDHTSAPYVALWDHTHFYHENSITLCIALSPHHHFCYHTSLPFYVSCRMYPKLPVAANQHLAFTHTGETRDLIGCYTFVVHSCEWDYFFLFSPIGDDIFSAHTASDKKKKSCRHSYGAYTVCDGTIWLPETWQILSHAYKMEGNDCNWHKSGSDWAAICIKTYTHSRMRHCP